MTFPDTSIGSIALLLLAGVLTGGANVALESAFGNPASAVGQGLIGFASVLVGFGLVYGSIFVRSYASSRGRTSV